ncbi:MAG: bifunctional adenosylcobinamide kinase/adenosylcobinamide-phosphate guanylyltransferase [Acidimicrobiia bacterium]|nr:bifunctional adenosylcobinamide kinase/adenosylcobinamide-phosphate guanylyltransferase [Acidimicrobiia bacterium]
MITLVLGGTRSGKSRVAEDLLEAHAGPLCYLATGSATDAELAARIAAHRARRPARVRTVEVGSELPAALRDAGPAPTLVDSLGSWVAQHADLTPDVDAVLAALYWRREQQAPTVLVSDEVGLSVHPPTEVGRRFVDALGDVNAAVSGMADDCWLVVAGRVLRLELP